VRRAHSCSDGIRLCIRSSGACIRILAALASHTAAVVVGGGSGRRGRQWPSGAALVPDAVALSRVAHSTGGGTRHQRSSMYARAHHMHTRPGSRERASAHSSRHVGQRERRAHGGSWQGQVPCRVRAGTRPRISSAIWEALEMLGAACRARDRTWRGGAKCTRFSARAYAWDGTHTALGWRLTALLQL